jgi:hypothetical protein
MKQSDTLVPANMLIDVRIRRAIVETGSTFTILTAEIFKSATRRTDQAIAQQDPTP